MAIPNRDEAPWSVPDRDRNRYSCDRSRNLADREGRRNFTGRNRNYYRNGGRSWRTRGVHRTEQSGYAICDDDTYTYGNNHEDLGGHTMDNLSGQGTLLDLAISEIEDRDGDIGVDGYLTDHAADGDYKSLKPIAIEMFTKLPKRTNLSRSNQEQRGRTFTRSRSKSEDNDDNRRFKEMRRRLGKMSSSKYAKVKDNCNWRPRRARY